MATLLESLLVVITSLSGVAALIAGLTYSQRNHSSPDKCKHRRWTKWKVEQVKPIHLYSAVDEGKDLPDRVDVYMTRQCVSCGTPQAKTVRGIDSPHFK